MVEYKYSETKDGILNVEFFDGRKINISKELILKESRYAHIDDFTMMNVLLDALYNINKETLELDKSWNFLYKL